MKKSIFVFLFISFFSFSCSDDPNSHNLLNTGDKIPAFSFTTLDGTIANIKDFEGKTIFLNFFSTWCSPCLKGLPVIQKQIKEGITDENLVILTFGRGHNAEDLIKWNKEKGFTFPICPDENQVVYEIFFSKYIPRNIVIGKDGRVILQECGYSEEGFERIIEAIKKDLEN